jgi:MFS family permease
MSAVEAAAPEGVPNHPLATRMGVVAAFSHNIVVGTIMGHFGLMLASSQERMGIGAEQASLGIPLVVVGSAIFSPLAGVLMAKFSLRMVLVLGAIFNACGFAILGLTNSFPLYLLAYGAFLGPAMALTGSIGPATLVTRWFTSNRGLALGVVHLPIVIAILPIALNWFLEGNGHTAAYLTIAAATAVILVPITLLTVDHPPGGEAPAPEPEALRTSDGSFTVAQLLAKPRFWALCLAVSSATAGAVLLGSLMVPMGVSWGFTTGQSAILQSLMSAVGIVGSILFGWIADKLGGARTLALIGLDCAILWLLLLLQPPFAATALIIGLIGLHGVGAIPSISKALSETFGQASFSRGYGINQVIALPFVVIAIIGAAGVYGATQSYAPAIIAMAGYYGLAMLLALFASTGSKAA